VLPGVKLTPELMRIVLYLVLGAFVEGGGVAGAEV
jgi:hypothetical protein